MVQALVITTVGIDFSVGFKFKFVERSVEFPLQRHLHPLSHHSAPVSYLQATPRPNTLDTSSTFCASHRHQPREATVGLIDCSTSVFTGVNQVTTSPARRPQIAHPIHYELPNMDPSLNLHVTDVGVPVAVGVENSILCSPTLCLEFCIERNEFQRRSFMAPWEVHQR